MKIVVAYPHAFYPVRWVGYFMLLMSFGILASIVYGFLQNTVSEIVYIFLFAITAVFAWLGWKSINDKTIVLQFGPDGLWTPKLGAVAWQQVLVKFKSIHIYKAGSSDLMMVLDRRTHRQLDWVSLTALNHSTESIKQLLIKYRKATVE